MTEQDDPRQTGPDPDPQQDDDPRADGGAAPPPDVPESPQVVSLNLIDSWPEGGIQ
jgi:hypothetical protein